MHYPVYMGLSFSNKDRLKDISTRWYQSGAYPVQSLNYTYNELTSAEKDALIFTDVNWTLFGSYLLQYGKGLFDDKKVILSGLILPSFSMNRLTEELGSSKILTLNFIKVKLLRQHLQMKSKNV